MSLVSNIELPRQDSKINPSRPIDKPDCKKQHYGQHVTVESDLPGGPATSLP